MITDDSYEMINEMSNTRMSMNVQAFMDYDVNLWGNQIELQTRDLEKGEKYFYIDSGFVSALLSFGVVFYSFLMFMYGVIMYKAWKYKNYFIYIVMLVFSFANIMNNFMVNIVICPFVALFLADFRTQSRIF